MGCKKEETRVHLTYKLLDSEASTKPHPQLRNDIQGLRALAIVFVLLFHMWPSKFRFGFFGVDMFFVISGYLIYMLLSKKKPLNGQKTADFYFRRIKRIIPIYLTIVACVLFAILHFVSPIEFQQVIDETVPALGFYSNMPSSRKTQYFDLSSKLYYFLHTWSLSVEIQFYLTVPLFFFAFQLLDKVWPVLKFVLIGCVPVASFLFQAYSTGDAAHMLLIARFWQFFAGFTAFHAYESGMLNFGKKGNNSGNSTSESKDKIASFSLCILLCMFLLFGIDLPVQFNRFFVIALTFLLVGRYNETCTLLTNKFAVLIGDASYSIYLIHWPLFTWNRYANMSQLQEGEEPGFLAGSVLILASIIAGYLVETAFKYILKYIDTWTILIFFLLAGYYLNGMLVFKLQANKVDLNDGDEVKSGPESAEKLRRDLLMLWNQRNRMPNYTNSQITAFNAEFNQIIKVMPFCEHVDKKLPSKFPMYMPGTYACHTEGTGTKNIVMIGNSHASFIEAGIAHLFKDVYKTFTYFGRFGCIPASKEFQQLGLKNHAKESCARLVNDTVKVLKQWNTPIDVLLVFYGLVNIPDIPLPKNIKTDKLMNQMQAFYSELDKIPKEFMMIYTKYPFFTLKPIREVSARMTLGKSLDAIGDTKEKVSTTLASAQQRVELIKCKKCLKLNMIDFWCQAKNNTFCHSTQKQGLIYFSDTNHVSPYGSLFAAEYIRKIYDQNVNKTVNAQ